MTGPSNGFRARKLLGLGATLAVTTAGACTPTRALDHPQATASVIATADVVVATEASVSADPVASSPLVAPRHTEVADSAARGSVTNAAAVVPAVSSATRPARPLRNANGRPACGNVMTRAAPCDDASGDGDGGARR